jgi:hypothetical protein
MILAEFIHKLQQYPQGMDIDIGISGDITPIFGDTGSGRFVLLTSRDSYHEGLEWADTETLKMPVPRTPGQWSFTKDKRYTYEKYCVNHNNKQQIEAGLSTVVAEISEGPHGLADARLIAAAPELLKSCIELANRIDELEGERHCSGVWLIANAIIKKATGE